MNFWIVVHSLEAYRLHSDLIGCRVKQSGTPRPAFAQFADIKKGDKIVYYAAKAQIVIGIFDVVSDMTLLSRDPYWKEVVVYSIKPSKMPRSGFYLDFKRALFGEKVSRFDLFPKLEYWYSYLQGKTCRKLTKHDFLRIRNWLNKDEYLVKIEKVKNACMHLQVYP